MPGETTRNKTQISVVDGAIFLVPVHGANHCGLYKTHAHVKTN